MSEPLKSKLPPKPKLGVMVFELRAGQYWPKMILLQEPSGFEIQSGERATPLCMKVLPQALDAVMQHAARQQSAMDILAAEFRAQFGALLDFPQAPEAPPTRTI